MTTIASMAGIFVVGYLVWSVIDYYQISRNCKREMDKITRRAMR